MKNWKTTVSGVLAAIFAALATQFPEQQGLFTALAALSGSIFAWFTKDRDVTGGTTQQ